MGRFDERYTEPQRQAVGQAMLDPHPITGKRVTAREAVDSLNRGELGCPPPQEPMPVTTAYWCRDRERERRQGFTLSPEARAALEDPARVNERLAQRLISIYERQLEKAESQIAKGNLDPQLFRLLAQTFRDISASVRKPDPRKKATVKTPREPGNTEPSPENAVAKLLEQHHKDRKGSNVALPQPSGQTNGASHSAARAASGPMPHAHAHT